MKSVVYVPKRRFSRTGEWKYFTDNKTPSATAEFPTYEDAETYLRNFAAANKDSSATEYSVDKVFKNY